MSAPQDLRGVVAQLCRCAPEEINGDFSLDVPALRGSLKKAVLIASIRRYLGKDCMSAATARTFAELEALVSGKAAPAAPARSAPLSAPVAAPASPAATVCAASCGIDVESVAQLPDTADYAGHQFYKDNFSPEEISYCIKQAKPRQHFAARWCAKEALKKCDAAFRDTRPADLELARADSGAVFFRLRGRVLPHAVSISHTEDTAVAVVLLTPAAHVKPAGLMPIAALVAALAAVSMSIFMWANAKVSVKVDVPHQQEASSQKSDAELPKTTPPKTMHKKQGLTDPLHPCLTGQEICPKEIYLATDPFILGGRDASHEQALNAHVKVGVCELVNIGGKGLVVAGKIVGTYPGPGTGGGALKEAIKHNTCFGAR